jgi:hypothetical protein
VTGSSYVIWRKSTYSNANGCVEVAVIDGKVAVRNSRSPCGAVLIFTPSEWEALLERVHSGTCTRDTDGGIESPPPASVPDGKGTSTMIEPGRRAGDLDHALWRTSTYSNNGACVEVAYIDGRAAVRDSKDRQGPVLVFTPTEWEAFVKGVRDGQFDLPLLG